MTLPPRMPTWSDADPAIRQRYERFLDKERGMNANNGIVEFHQDGLQLAYDLRQAAMALGYSRAHECSNDIYWLLQAAATVMFLLVGLQSAAFREYLEGVLYYRDFESTRDRANAFLAYTKCDA